MARDDTKTRLARAATLLEAVRDLQAKMNEEIEELTRAIHGGIMMADQVQDFEATFAALWSGRYGGAYAWQYTKDRPQIKRLIKLLGLEELKGRAGAYLRESDPFYGKARHAFNLFVASVNRLTVPMAVDDLTLEAPPVADCLHVPRCVSDQEHTKRRMAEVRS